MAKQTGDTVFVGTWDGVTFYEMNGEFYVRTKSSLTGKRVKKDPAYALTRLYAEWLAIASPIAAAVYRTLPKDTRKRADYQSLTGMAIQLLKAGVEAEEVKVLLEEVGVQLLNERGIIATEPVVNEQVATGQEKAIEQDEPITFVYDEMECLVKLPLVVKRRCPRVYNDEKRLILPEATRPIFGSNVCT